MLMESLSFFKKLNFSKQVKSSYKLARVCIFVKLFKKDYTQLNKIKI